MNLNRIAIITICCFAGIHSADAQSIFTKRDSTVVFGTMTPSSHLNSLSTPTHSLGVNLFVSTNGFGLGMFYRHEYSDDLSGFIDFSVSEAKDDDEKDFVDYYGRTFTPGKVNRFLVLPVLFGIEKRMFQDDIVDNFRPYIMGAAGPTMIYVFPYNEEYFSALGKGQPKYTIGGYLGIGAYFGSERSNVLGLNLRYYFIPYPGGIESLVGVQKNQFGGVSISLSFGSGW